MRTQIVLIAEVKGNRHWREIGTVAAQVKSQLGTEVYKE